MSNQKLLLFIALPICLNLAFIGFYFSGNQFLQYLIAPQFDWLHHRSWREFGLLEQLQNAYLLIIFILFATEVIKRPLLLEKTFFLSGALVMLFLLLEELDYGVHFYEYAIGQESAIEVTQRNWHNRDIAGKSINGRLKRSSNLLTIIWFFVFPLLALATTINFKSLKAIIPSPWFIAGFTLVLLFSSLSHYLDDIGMAYIDDMQGGLKGNISEFRETNTYYLFLLYAVQLVTTKELLFRQPRKT